VNELASLRMNGPLGYDSTGWRARLTLARLGFKSDIDTVVKVLSEMSTYLLIPKTDIMEWAVFVRQPETIAFIRRQYIDSDEAMSTSDRLENSAVRASKFINTAVPVVPIVKTNFTEEQIVDLRNWFKHEFRPEMIKSRSLLLDGKLVNTIDAPTPVADPIKDTPARDSAIETSNHLWYIVTGICVVFSICFFVLHRNKKRKD
jgi:hypothetical protein